MDLVIKNVDEKTINTIKMLGLNFEIIGKKMFSPLQEYKLTPNDAKELTNIVDKLSTNEAIIFNEEQFKNELLKRGIN